MYETYFNLRQRPFASVPRIDHYFPAATIESSRKTLIRCVERSEGAGIVVGASGTGKSLLCRLLAERFRHASQVALLAGGYLGSRRAMLQAILHELAQPYRGMDEGELRLALVDYITLSDECPCGMVLLVDEAQAIPLRLLDEIRALTNLVRGGQPAVRLVLAGSRMLEERLASPKLESFSQRLAARCYLEALSRAETQAYIHAWIAAAGGQGPNLFPAEACGSVYKATDGVPRLINQLCDRAMLAAYAAGHRRLESVHVEEAWADLQQLPTPWNEKPRDESSGVIEFGHLEDDPDDGGPADDQSDGPVEAQTLPMLRISPEVDDAGSEPDTAEPAEPAGQIRHIQRLLADVEEEFPPAGSGDAESPSIFDEGGHPFREAFAQEEVVTDRYAGPAKPSPDAHGRFGAGSADAGGAAARCVAGAPQNARASDPAVPAAACLGGERDAEACALILGEVGDPRTTASDPRSTGHDRVVKRLEPDDSDMLIVEEGYEDAPPWPVRSVVPVRRTEYSRLFAQLRRG